MLTLKIFFFSLLWISTFTFFIQEIIISFFRQVIETIIGKKTINKNTQWLEVEVLKKFIQS